MYRLLLVTVVSMTTMEISRVHADEVNLWLDLVFNDICRTNLGGTWTLEAEVKDTGSGANGRFGISAVRALIDDIDPTVTFSTGIGAIDPVDPTGNPRPAVMTTQGGTLDIIYGQDLSESEGRIVVPGVGVGDRVTLASGTFPEDSFPRFGDDDQGHVSEALFLNTDTSPYGSAVDADEVNTFISGAVAICGIGDFDSNGAIGNSDLTLLLDHWGEAVPPVPEGWINDGPTSPGVGNDDLVRLLDNWGKSYLISEHSAVPEPTSMAIVLLAGIAALLNRARSERVRIVF